MSDERNAVVRERFLFSMIRSLEPRKTYCMDSFFHYHEGKIMQAPTVHIECLHFDVVSKLVEVELCLETGEHQMFLIDDVWALNHAFFHRMVTNMEIPHWVYATMKGYRRMQLKEKVQEKQE